MSKNLLKEKLVECQQRNPSYSLRAFANTLGVSASTLSTILSGKSRLTRRMAIQFADRLNLTPDEGNRLIRSSVTPKGGGRKWVPYSDEFIELSPEDFAKVSDWKCYAILSLGDLPTNRRDPAWIAKMLDIPQEEAAPALHKLLSLGIIEPRGNGFKQSTQPFTTREGHADRNLQNLHKSILARAERSLDVDDINERDFSMVTMATSQKKLAEAKALIKNFRRELMALMENDEHEQVYVMSIQLFPLSVKAES